jgi:ankyrin repeat protein
MDMGPIVVSETSTNEEKKRALALLLDCAVSGHVDQLTPEFFHSIASVTIDGEPLIEKGDDFDNYTALVTASRAGRNNVVRLLVEEGKADINKKGGWNEITALMKAAEKGNDSTVLLLLELGADINLQNSFGNSALMLAAEKGRAEAMDILLGFSTNIKTDLKNNYEYTAMILAAESGHYDCVNLLVKHGANMNLPNMFGKTALIMAAENGMHEIVELLCDAGADINLRSKRGVSALMLASVKGHLPVVLSLTRPEYGVDIHVENNDRSDNALTMACLGGKATIVKHLVDIGADVHYRNANKETVLMKACERGDQGSMDYLLSYFTSAIDILVILTSQNKHGNTCLMRACTTGNIKVAVYVLLKLTEQWSLGGDALKNVSRSGETAELARLIYNYPSRSAFVTACYNDVKNKDGDTALSLLAKYYRDNPKKFNDFVEFASTSRQRLHLFAMLPRSYPPPPASSSPPLGRQDPQSCAARRMYLLTFPCASHC